MNLESEMHTYTMRLCIKQISNENPVSQRKQCSMVAEKGKEIQKRGCIWIRTLDSLCYTAKTSTTLVINYTKIKILKHI